MHCGIIDTLSVPDVFVSELAEIEDLGEGCFRFVFVTRRHIGNGEEYLVVAKLIVPRSAIAPAILMTAKAVGYSMAAGGYFAGKSLN